MLISGQAARLSGPSVNGPAWRIEEQSTVKNPPSQDKKNKPFGWRQTDRIAAPRSLCPGISPLVTGLYQGPCLSTPVKQGNRAIVCSRLRKRGNRAAIFFCARAVPANQ